MFLTASYFLEAREILSSDTDQLARERPEVFYLYSISAPESKPCRRKYRAFTAARSWINADFDISERIVSRARPAPKFAKANPPPKDRSDHRVVPGSFNEHCIQRFAHAAREGESSQAAIADLSHQSVLSAALQRIELLPAHEQLLEGRIGLGR